MVGWLEGYLPNSTQLTANDTLAIVNTAAQLRKAGEQHCTFHLAGSFSRNQ